MPATFIYDVFKNEEYVGDLKADEIEEKFGINKRTVSQAANEGRLVKKHYRIEKVDTVIPRNSPLLMEFDGITKRILRKAGKA